MRHRSWVWVHRYWSHAQRDRVQVRLRVGAVEPVVGLGRRDAPIEDIDAQGTAAGAHRLLGLLDGRQDLLGVRQEDLPVQDQLGASGVRTRSVTLMCLSRAAIRLETACWLIPSSSAAAWNWPLSATATNTDPATGTTEGSTPRWADPS